RGRAAACAFAPPTGLAALARELLPPFTTPMVPDVRPALLAARPGPMASARSQLLLVRPIDRAATASETGRTVTGCWSAQSSAARAPRVREGRHMARAPRCQSSGGRPDRSTYAPTGQPAQPSTQNGECNGNQVP